MKVVSVDVPAQFHRIAVALLTCDRYEYTVQTVEALCNHNDLSAWPLFYADDHSDDPRIRRYVESQGFRPVLLNDGERMGCSPMSDGLLQAVLRETGPEWFVLYLQNDFVATRPIPLDVAAAWFADPAHATLRMQHFPGRLRRRQRKHAWPIREYAGEPILEMATAAWPVQLSRLGWYAAIAAGAKREHTLHRRARRQRPQPITGIMLTQVFRHVGRAQTPRGIFRSRAGFGGLSEVVVTMTTVPHRVEACYEAICSILLGRRKPDRLVLNVAFDPPPSLTDLPIEINRLEEDLGPATKLIPVLERYRGRGDVLLVTADDDVAYPATWLETLVAGNLATPGCVVCGGGRRIAARPYRAWKKTRGETKPSLDMLPLGVYGVAWRPNHFTDRVFELATMRRTTARNDDLWFAATRRQCVPVRVVDGERGRALNPPGPRLSRRNVRIENDRAIARLQRELGWPQHKETEHAAAH